MKPHIRAETKQQPARKRSPVKAGKKADVAQKPANKKKGAAASRPRLAQAVTEHIVEIVSDSGEGAQRCGQSLAAIAARTGLGIWTVEIIPAEIQPPARSVAGKSVV